MGRWNVTLYGCDDAADLRGAFQTLAKIPCNGPQLVARVKKEFPALRRRSAEGYCDLWLALRDQLHAYCLESEEAEARTRDLIADGLDDKVNREAGLSPGDATRRRAVLEALLRKWATPPRRPKARRASLAPDPHVFEVGDIVAYPTSHGRPGNPYYPTLEGEHGWRQNGWGTFIVLSRGHVLKRFTWLVIGRLSVHGRAKPTLAACRASAIENQPDYVYPTGKGRLAIEGGAISPKIAKALRLEHLGRVDLDPARVTKSVPGVNIEPRRPPWVPLAVLEWWTPASERSNAPGTPGHVDAPSPVLSLRKLMG